MLKAGDLRKGKTIIHEGELAVVHEANHVAKGNKRSYMRTKIKNLRTGTMTEVRFRVDDLVEVPYVESKEYEFLYRDGDNLIVMDLETYDQLPVSDDLLGEAKAWLTPNQHVTCQIFDGRMISFELPHVVELEVTEAPPVIKGATATNQNKEVTLETGARIRVPPFIDTGEHIRVDTRTGEYIERAK